MKRMKAAIVIAMSMYCSGCVNQVFVKGVDSGMKVIAPEYVKYVENDNSLDRKSKDIRLKTMADLLDLIGEAKK